MGNQRCRSQIIPLDRWRLWSARLDFRLCIFGGWRNGYILVVLQDLVAGGFTICSRRSLNMLDFRRLTPKSNHNFVVFEWRFGRRGTPAQIVKLTAKQIFDRKNWDEKLNVARSRPRFCAKQTFNLI